MLYKIKWYKKVIHKSYKAGKNKYKRGYDTQSIAWAAAVASLLNYKSSIKPYV